jgi:hypothetical protein
MIDSPPAVVMRTSNERGGVDAPCASTPTTAVGRADPLRRSACRRASATSGATSLSGRPTAADAGLKPVWVPGRQSRTLPPRPRDEQVGHAGHEGPVPGLGAPDGGLGPHPCEQLADGGARRPQHVDLVFGERARGSDGVEADEADERAVGAHGDDEHRPEPQLGEALPLCDPGRVEAGDVGEVHRALVPELGEQVRQLGLGHRAELVELGRDPGAHHSWVLETVPSSSPTRKT